MAFKKEGGASLLAGMLFSLRDIFKELHRTREWQSYSIFIPTFTNGPQNSKTPKGKGSA